MHDVLIAFGSNLGEEAEILTQTVARLNDSPNIKVVAVSEAKRTSPVGGPEGQSDYLNAAIRISTRLDPHDLHQETRRIETELGRERKVRWGSRKIDLDILLFDDRQISSDPLTIPHPRMSFRRFVLEPAVEVAPDMTHPVSGCSITQLLSHINEQPNQIVYVSEQNDRTTAICDRVNANKPEQWKLLTTNQLAEFEAWIGSTKLMAWDQSCSAEFEAVIFSGPAVRVPESIEDAARELLAAIEAMMP